MRHSKVVTFLKLLAPYLVILAIVIIFGIKSYYKMLDLSIAETINTQRSILDNTEEVISLRLAEIENFAIELSYDEKYRMMIMKSNGFGHYDKVECWKAFKNRMKNNDFIYNYYVFFKNSDFLISSNQLSERPELYYNNFLKYNSLSYQEWYDKFISKYHDGIYLPVEEVTINNKKESVITYIHSLPLDMRKDFGATLVVLIKEDEIKQYFNTYATSDGGASFILDKNGKIIAEVGGDRAMLDKINTIDITDKAYDRIEYDGEEMLVVSTVSNYNQWQYISIIKEKTVLTEVNVIKDNTFKLTIVIISLLTLLALAFAYYNSRPLNKWIQRLKFYDKNNSANKLSQFSILDNLIDNVIENNLELKQVVTEHMPLVKSAILVQLTTKSFSNEDEIDQLIQGTGLSLTSSYYCMGLVRIGGYVSELSNEAIDELNYNRIMTNKIINNILSGEHYVFYLGDNQLAILFLGNDDNLSDVISSINNIAIDITESLKESGINVFVSLGNAYRCKVDIYKSFKEAKKVSENVIYNHKKQICWYHQIELTQNYTYYFPMDLENKIINVVKSGNVDETKKIINHLIDKNTNLPLDSIVTERFLLYEICGTLYKIYDEGNLDQKETVHLNEFMNKVTSLRNLEKVLNSISDEFIRLSELFSKQKNQKYYNLKKDIIDYIENSYQNSNLGLADISAKFGFSEIYFSQLFKEQTGENLSTYIEKLRMEKAKILLKTTEKTIEMIAKEIGYNSTNTFHKAFKRVENITPGTYKKNAK